MYGNNKLPPKPEFYPNENTHTEYMTTEEAIKRRIATLEKELNELKNMLPKLKTRMCYCGTCFCGACASYKE